MKISILLPYKENFSPTYAGAVSLFINDTVSISRYKKQTIIFVFVLTPDYPKNTQQTTKNTLSFLRLFISFAVFSNP